MSQSKLTQLEISALSRPAEYDTVLDKTSKASEWPSG